MFCEAVHAPALVGVLDTFAAMELLGMAQVRASFSLSVAQHPCGTEQRLYGKAAFGASL